METGTRRLEVQREGGHLAVLLYLLGLRWFAKLYPRDVLVGDETNQGKRRQSRGDAQREQQDVDRVDPSRLGAFGGHVDFALVRVWVQRLTLLQTPGCGQDLSGRFSYNHA